MSLIILFGPTGAGKTYVGRLIEKEFGYYFYDGDTDLTDEMKKALNQMTPITDAMRDRFINKLLNSITRLSRNQAKLVVAQTFIKEKYRRELHKRWPQAKFVLVKTKPKIRFQRWRKRANYPWSEAYVKQMDAQFEPPKIPHQVLTNDSTGSTHLKVSLQRLVSEL